MGKSSNQKKKKMQYIAKVKLYVKMTHYYTASKVAELCGFNAVINALQCDLDIELMNKTVYLCNKSKAKQIRKQPERSHRIEAGIPYFGRLSLDVIHKLLLSQNHSWKIQHGIRRYDGNNLENIKLDNSKRYILYGWHGSDNSQAHYVACVNGFLLTDVVRRSSLAANVRKFSVPVLRTMFYGVSTCVRVYELYEIPKL